MIVFDVTESPSKDSMVVEILRFSQATSHMAVLNEVVVCDRLQVSGFEVARYISVA